MCIYTHTLTVLIIMLSCTQQDINKHVNFSHVMTKNI